MEDKIVFIHIPKTGGSTISHLPFVQTAGHLTAEEAMKKFGPHRKYFTFVRNPLSRFRSAHRHMLRYPSNFQWYMKIVNEYKTFNGVAENIYRWAHQYSSHYMIRSAVDQLCIRSSYFRDIDFIGHLESIHADIEQMVNLMGFDKNYTIKHLNKAEVKGSSEPEPYTDEGAAAVLCFYKQDAEWFNYI